MKYILWSLISAVIIFLAGMKVGKSYFSKTDIKIVEKEVTKTEYKVVIKEPSLTFEDLNQLNECYKSPLQFGFRQDGNMFTVYSWDKCKESSVKYEVKTGYNYKPDDFLNLCLTLILPLSIFRTCHLY
jgi:hypothetical protein